MPPQLGYPPAEGDQLEGALQEEGDRHERAQCLPLKLQLVRHVVVLGWARVTFLLTQLDFF